MDWDAQVKAAAAELKKLSEVAEKHLGKLFEDEGDGKDKETPPKDTTPPHYRANYDDYAKNIADLVGDDVKYAKRGVQGAPDTVSAWAPPMHWWLSTTHAPLRMGHLVHFRSYGTPRDEHPHECRPAIVTRLHSDKVGMLDICVFGDSGVFFKQRIMQDPGRYVDGFVDGAWHRDCGE